MHKQRSYINIVCCILGCLLLWQNAGAAHSDNDSLRIKGFVERSSILLLNAKPSENDIQRLCATFSLYDSFATHKKLLIDSFMHSPEFSKSIFDQFRFEYLQGVDMDQIEEAKSDFKFLQTLKSQSSELPFFIAEYKKLEDLENAEYDLINNKKSIKEVQKIFFYNKFYDDANMGADNYITSTFNYLFFRLPTKYELRESKKLVNNISAVLFLSNGNNKRDYLDILFSSKSYVEGQVRYWYSKLLARSPSLEEEIKYLNMDRGFTIETLIEQILISDDVLTNVNGTKSQKKTAMSFISIGSEDYLGRRMEMEPLQHLERSYNAFGDHDIMENIIVRSILNKRGLSVISENDTNLVDPAYDSLLKNCPVFGQKRSSSDPLLMCISSLFYYINNAIDIKESKNIFEGYNKYLSWQKRIAPHSPWGLNEAPGYLSGGDRILWQVKYTRNWVESYPKEYLEVLKYYNNDINTARSTISNKEFLLNNCNRVGRRMPEVISLLKQDKHDAGLVDIDKGYTSKLTNDPGSFVEDLYENCLMRHPTPEEKQALLKIIKDNPQITPEMIYYSIMTSEEYKYY